MGSGFSFTPDEDGSSAGEDQPGDQPTPAGVPPPAIAGAALGHGAGRREQGRAAGPADGSGGGSGDGTSAAPAAADECSVAEIGGGEAGGGGKLRPMHGVDLEHSFRLASADGLATPFTNYVRGCGTELGNVTYLRQTA